MKFEKIGILTSKQSWFVPYAEELVHQLGFRGRQARLFFSHEEIPCEYKIIFILSYFKMVDKEFLKKHKHNLVVHESGLPKGRGWSPLFWQILEGKNKIPIVLFKVTEKIDEGDIYIEDYIVLEGHELYSEIRDKQGLKTIELCLKFLDQYENLKPVPQKGKPTYYRKRTPHDSELDINRTIKEQFNLLRIVDNEMFPAFFYYRGKKYIIKVFKGETNDKDNG